MTRILMTIALVVLLGACQSSESSEGHVRFDPVEPFAPGSTTTTTVAARTEAPQWTARAFTASNADGTTRTCVELSIGATVATTCAGSPGVSSWTVAGAHFVVALGDIALKNGAVIRADALGLALGFLPSDTVPTSDVPIACGRHDLATAVAEHYPDSTVAWQPSRCEAGGGVASATALLEDRSEAIALLEKTNDGQWQVFATFRAPVRCKLLDPSSRNKCKVLRYDD
ncbi:MAG TPA: hypothetical protein VM282_14465 [Acidimicrobiales bacterium]|nr:hypothetical protein [Acidimicrobiales bacterium]